MFWSLQKLVVLPLNLFENVLVWLLSVCITINNQCYLSAIDIYKYVMMNYKRLLRSIIIIIIHVKGLTL